MLIGLITGTVLLSVGGIGLFFSPSRGNQVTTAAPQDEDLQSLKAKALQDPKALSNSDWRRVLTPEQFEVTREFGTERPWSSPLNAIESNDDGVFACSNCGESLFLARDKYAAGTGWPSFKDVISAAVIGTRKDRKLGVERTEVHCNRCGAHLGHVFDDGPPPKGLRYCMNGVALQYVDEEED